MQIRLCATHYISGSLVVRLNLFWQTPNAAPINPRGIQTPIDVSEMPQLDQKCHSSPLGKVNNPILGAVPLYPIICVVGADTSFRRHKHLRDDGGDGDRDDHDDHDDDHDHDG